jgi:hypothetical protein
MSDKASPSTVPTSSQLDLSAGSILHIEGYSSGSHAPKDKFLFIIGPRNPAVVLAFLLSSQEKYTVNAIYKKELVQVPMNAAGFMSKPTHIQCWNVEELDVGELQKGALDGRVTCVGKFGVDIVGLVLDVVSESSLLRQIEISEVARVLSC